MSRLALYLLGPPHLERNGEPVHISRRKAVALLAYLAMTGRSHSRDVLATLLWPEFDQSRASAELRRILSTLNRTLGEEWLTVDRETAGLNPEAGLWLDVARFRQRLAVCETYGHPVTDACPACVPLLEEAAGLYRDDFMAGFTLRDSVEYDDWQFFETEGLRDELASALERLVRGYSSRGEYEAAIPYARRWLALDPLHEPAHRQLMQLYARTGHRSAALRQYRKCVRVLEEELGVPPSDETTALYERIRAERVRPAEREVTAPTSPSSVPPHLPAFLAEEEAPAAVERPVFVTRERKLARLNGYLDTALAGHGRAVFVTGGPGRGKTALLREFARRAMEVRPDLLVASGNCNAYSGVSDPYLPFREVLGMLTGDVEARWAAGAITREGAQRLWASLPLAVQALLEHGPSLVGTVVPGAALLSRATAVAPGSADWLQELRALSQWEKPSHGDLEQSALFEQYTNVLRALAAQHPLLLILDDVQWADAASISLLFHLGRRLEGNRIMIACAYRPEEVAMGGDGAPHPLEKALSEFKRRFGDVWVDLARTDEREGRRFVDAFLDTKPNRLEEDFQRGMFQHTGGHPLFTVELLRAMQERGDLVQDDDGAWVVGAGLDWETLPARVEAVIEARVARLDEDLRDILAVASVEGEDFTAQVVAEVQDIPEQEMLRALSQELGMRHRLVRERGEVQVDHRFLSYYQFAHALFQQYLYNGLSAGERRLLHGEIAAVLEELYEGHTEEITAAAGQLARHYEEAGIVEKAIEYLLTAGKKARRMYANEEAIGYFQRALERLDALPLGQSRKDWRLEALKGLGQIYFGTGKVAEAERYLREAIALGQETGLSARELVRLYYWLGEALFWQGRRDEVIPLGEEGLALLAAEDVESVEAALMNQHIAVASWQQGNKERFRELTNRTEQFIQRLPYSAELRPAYIHIAAVGYASDKNVGEAMKWFQTLERQAQQHHDLRALGEVNHRRALIMVQSGDTQEGISQAQQALELYTRIGDVKLASEPLLDLGWYFLLLGDLQRAEAYVHRAVEITETLGLKTRAAWAYQNMGSIFLCQGVWEQAVDAFRKASQLPRKASYLFRAAIALVSLGRTHLARGQRQEALKRFQEAVVLVGPDSLQGFPDWRPPFAGALSGLEDAYEDPEALPLSEAKGFRAFCHRYRARFREEHPEDGDSSGRSQSAFVQWYLEPTEPFDSPRTLVYDDFVESLSSDWVWQDPFDDCSFRVQDGLEIHAANGRDLWHVNLSAPRILRPASGDFAVQTVCVPVSDPAIGAPAIGGLLLWKGKENYLRLDRGIRGQHEISLEGCLGNKDVVIGRGRLPSERVFLRLERIDRRVNALCSADGVDWFTVGHVEFPVEDPVEVGLHAIGNIDRTVYHGAYPDGTAIRFESFQLWGA